MNQRVFKIIERLYCYPFTEKQLDEIEEIMR